ncbi:hypothetical protein HUT17_04980 (plasmid) [Nocardiopsis flavescens]|nr:hypothetical protein HUT17_04980 [Nocardiopsis flavescens]
MSTQGTQPKRGRGRPPLYQGPRTQYTVRLEMHEDSALQTLATKAGYPTVSAYVTALVRQRAHEELAAAGGAGNGSEEEAPGHT